MNAQRGQVLVLGTLLVAAATLAFVRYFDVGMVLQRKSQQDHVLRRRRVVQRCAGAGRSLNMLAYINRAQMAHQVAMAHLVTLGSLAHFAGTEAQRAARANPPAYVIGMHFGAAHSAAYSAALKAVGLESYAMESGQLAAAHAQHDRLARSVLANVAMQVATATPKAREAAVREVLAANFPQDEDFNLVFQEDDFPSFLSAYRGDSRLRPFATELTSLYPFLGPRDHTERSALPVSGRCPTRRHELRRRGRSLLDDSGKWQAIDTQSYHALRSNRTIGCYFREYAMGWGWIPPLDSASIDEPYVDDAPDDFSEQDFWRWVHQSTDWDLLGGNANPLANSWARTSRRQWAGGGLHTFHDLASAKDQHSTRFRVVLKRQSGHGPSVTSYAAAETYFRRPHERPDGRIELANLFHPYWQARMSSPGRAEIPQ